MKTLIIDGNNLIHKVMHLKAQFSRNKTASQRSLIESLKGKLHGYKSLIIVFDGHSEFTSPGVFFSCDKSADEVIRKKIEEFKNPRLLKVVSSDYEIINFARVCGCEVLKSEVFWNEVSSGYSVTRDKNINQRFIYDENVKPDLSKKDKDEIRKFFT